MWIKSPAINCVHGFSTRHGGISPSPYDSLNLGGSQDLPENISKNRQLALEGLNLSYSKLCYLKQVHGNHVCVAQPGAQEGDAIVTNQKDLVLAISIADCYPILFYDEINNVIGAAHAGWRGTQAKIAGTTVNAMLALGAKAENIKVAIGQGICQDNFEVGVEVIQKFRESGFPESCWNGNKIDLVKANFFILLQHTILKENIWTMNRCTFEKDFFSHRRDKGITGRMWAVISMS
ncbi:laccase [Sphingobacteriaceae bacterium]|nr:laccase [Sphingobacteriaceae bacterium]